MRRKLNWLLAAVIILTLTACRKDNNTDTQITGRWTADVSGATQALWGDGKALRMTEFASDGTGSTDIYYLLYEDIAIARAHQTFRYTLGTDGQLTMIMDGNQATETATWSMADRSLTLQKDGQALTLQRADAATERRLAEWEADDDLISVPAPARYTVFIYGNAGGTMDHSIEEGLWDNLKPLLTDKSNVRVVCFYKYGKDLPEENRPFSGIYADPGDIVWFELDNQTDLDKLRAEGMQALGLDQEARDMKLCDPATLCMFLRFSSLYCPAENYVFSVWGHGSGFDAINDIPGKYDNTPNTRGVINDEWNNNEQLDMYELSYALRTVSPRPLDNIFFHNCLMGNLETLTELRDVTDYITCSSHVLCSNGRILIEYIRGLMEKGNTPEAVDQMFPQAGEEWTVGYLLESSREPGPNAFNGDMKLLRTDRIDPILTVAKRLAERLVAQYPAQKEAIDRATRSVYRFETVLNSPYFKYPMYDLADYAHKVAMETADQEFAAIAADIDAAFSDAILRYEDVNWNSERFLPHYTLSVCLVDHDAYTHDFMNDPSMKTPLCNFNEGYEQTSFHRITGWGAWLNNNLQRPQGRKGDWQDKE